MGDSGAEMRQHASSQWQQQQTTKQQARLPHLHGQAPQLVEALHQAHQPIGVHRHERLHAAAAARRRQRGRGQGQRLAKDDGRDGAAQLGGQQGLAIAKVGAQEGLQTGGGVT